jgi:hypothetical protein
VITYYLPASLKTLTKLRQEAEQELRDADQDVFYPAWDDLRAEDREEKPRIILTIRDAEGQVVRRLAGPASQGLHRVTWNMRWPSSRPASTRPWQRENPWDREPAGPRVPPGTFTVSLAQEVRGELTSLEEPQSFTAVPLGMATLPAQDLQVLAGFQRQTARLQRAVLGTERVTAEAQSRLDHLKQALLDTPEADPSLQDQVRELDNRLKDLLIILTGDRTVSSRSEPTSPSITSRVNRIIWGGWSSTAGPTKTQQESYQVAAAAFAELLPQLRQLIEVDLVQVENEVEAAGGPWTPGRFPQWEDR